jgi:opacity protein-like surface antigen
MSLRFSFVTLAATCAVLASPLVASAQTLTPQRPNNNRYQTITNTEYSNQKAVPNYVGVGGSNRGAALESKFAFNDHFSFRPTAIDNLKSDNQKGDFSLPVTYDFKPVFGKLQPYAGGGLGITAEDNTDVGGMFTAGADYPINKSVTANASVNYDAFGNNDVNGVIGVAANFKG